MEISVSILSEKDNYKEAINKLNDSIANYLHLDIMDNTFTNTISFSLKEVKEIVKLNKKKLDIHIMSNNLDNILNDYIKLKPDIISIHLEAANDIKRYINQIKDNNIKVSLAINPDTNIEELYPYLNDIDQILVMSVTPGKGGQEYIKSTNKKIKKLYKLKNKYNFDIEVDGGINDITIKKIKKYLDVVAVGSYITRKNDYNCQIKSLIK